jgi:hypothetical protein
VANGWPVPPSSEDPAVIPEPRRLADMGAAASPVRPASGRSLAPGPGAPLPWRRSAHNKAEQGQGWYLRARRPIGIAAPWGDCCGLLPGASTSVRRLVQHQTLSPHLGPGVTTLGIEPPPEWEVFLELRQAGPPTAALHCPCQGVNSDPLPLSPAIIPRHYPRPFSSTATGEEKGCGIKPNSTLPGRSCRPPARGPSGPLGQRTACWRSCGNHRVAVQ